MHLNFHLAIRLGTVLYKCCLGEMARNAELGLEPAFATVVYENFCNNTHCWSIFSRIVGTVVSYLVSQHIGCYCCIV